MKTAILLNISFSFLSNKNMGLCAGLRRRAVADHARVRIRFTRIFLARRVECFPPEDLSLATSFPPNFSHARDDYGTGVPSESFSWIEVFMKVSLNAQFQSVTT